MMESLPGNNKSVSQEIVKDLIRTFPSLAGIKVEHAWGGPTAGSLDFTPSVGVMGEHGNIYYGVGLQRGRPLHTNRRQNYRRI